MGLMRYRAMVMVTILAAGSAAGADDDTAGIRERGIVLQATKKTYLVVVPDGKEMLGDLPVHPPAVYYGDGKTFYLQERDLWEGPISTRISAAIDLDDWREVHNFQHLETRDMKAWTMKCGSRTKQQLSLAPESAAKKILAAGTFKDALPGHEPILLARASTGTTYYLVDHPHLPKDNSDFRLFIGKRGAMKQVKLKDLSVDSDGFLLVSAQGVLKVDNGSPRTATFGRDGDHLKPLDVIPTSPNAKLVFGDLGVYRHENFGMICDDL
ncbi:MAG TPA: hypothetical protein VLB44_16440 [Kofleriaceae bacterium]|nr:hypothetical protein [Kofleriaceae bacterium]